MASAARSHSVAEGPVLSAYAALLAAGELRADPDQAAAAARLDRLALELAAPPVRTGFIDRLLGRDEVAAPRGVYLWGGVGRGKTMLMDLFCNAAPGPKRRVHFHPFMLEVHARLARLSGEETRDPLPRIGAEIAAENRLLCLDEFFVRDPGDAFILARLFTGLLDAGAAVVTTSNRPPRDLYQDGLNRELFLPFIDLIAARLDVLPLNGPVDYRLDRLGGMPTYHVPNGPDASRALSEAFFRLTDYPVEDRAKVPAIELPLAGGRALYVPKALKGVSVFSFKRLCREARGAADYIALAEAFHTVILVGVPRLGPDRRNEAARFVTLVDALYDAKVKLLVAADAEPDDLYPAGDGAFEFERTASRLIEMQSADYLARGHCS